MEKRGSKRATTTPVEWPTVFLIAACYGTWIIAGLLVWPSYPLIALALMTLTVALQSSLVHEVLHGHPTRNARVNEALVSLPIGLVWPYRRFKTMHLRHHADERLTDPLDDPESFYRALWQHEGLPEAMKLLLRINNTMAGRFVLGPLLSCVGFILGDVRAIRAGDKAVRQGLVAAWRGSCSSCCRSCSSASACRCGSMFWCRCGSASR